MGAYKDAQEKFLRVFYLPIHTERLTYFIFHVQYLQLRRVLKVRKSKIAESPAVQTPNWVTVLELNTITAILAQVLIGVNLWMGLKPRWNEIATLSPDGFYRLIVTVLFVATIFVSAILFVVTFTSENDIGKHSKYGLEFLRAMYCSIIGILAVSFTKTIALGRIGPSIGLAVMIVVLIILSRYRQRLREARHGKWFPYLVFHFSIQCFVLWPLCFKLLNRFL
jgi:hypothetical protein